jgi:hypothetical protein
LPLQFQTEIKPAHVREATAGVFRSQVTRPALLLGLAALLGLAQALFWVIAPVFDWKWRLALAGLMLLSVVCATAFAGIYYRELALKNFERFTGAPLRVRLEDAAYHYEAAWGRGELAWSRFQSLWCLKQVWVLLEHSERGASVLLPAADLDEEARVFIKSRLAREGARVMD